MPQYKGLIVGLITAALGISPVIFNNLIDLIINPYKVKPVSVGIDRFFDEEIASQVPLLLQKLSVILTIIAIISVSLCF